MYTAARVISFIFSPLVVPTYALILAVCLSYLQYTSPMARIVVAVVTFVATCLIPSGIMLGVRHLHSDNLLKGALSGYLITAACYLGAGVYFRYVNAPLWLSMMFVGGSLALIIQALVRLKWNMSGHAVAMGGILALLFFMISSGNGVGNLQWAFLPAVIVASLVAMSQLILERHTLCEITLGFFDGFVCVLGAMWVVII